MQWLFKCTYYKTIIKICKDSYDKYNIELEEQRKLELKLEPEQNKVKEIATKEVEEVNKIIDK